MLKNYFKTAWRTMVKDKTYATINILGLTIGLSACMLVFTVVIDELSYDKFWKRADDLYIMYATDKMADGVHQRQAYTLEGLGKALKDHFPEVEQYTPVRAIEQRFRIGDENPDGVAVNVLTMDTSALAMFDFEPVDGQLPHYVAGQQNLLITEKLRDKYFQGENPVGQTIDDVPSWSKEKRTFLITGVIKDIPQNTHLRAEALVLTSPSNRPLSKEGFGNLTTMYYLLKPNADTASFIQKANQWVTNYLETREGNRTLYGLQPISDVYLDSYYDSRTTTVHGNRNTLYILIGVGTLLLFIACINFVNLSTARAMRRIKETGVRKVLGAQRSQLVSQFLTESLLFFLLSTMLAVGLYIIGLPVIERFIGHGLSFSLLTDPGPFCYTALLILLMSMITGAYPAWLLSSFKPANTLRGIFFQRGLVSASGLRETLVVLQFAIAIVVLVALLVVHQQVNYLANKDIGYEKENLLHIGARNWENKGETFRNELEKLPGMESVSIAGWDPVNGVTTATMNLDHPLKEGEKVTVHFITADFNFTHTMGFDLQAGRYLDAEHGTDVFDGFAEEEEDESEKNTHSKNVLVTSSTAKMLGIEELDVSNKIGFTIVGILKDFHRESLHHALGPVVIAVEEDPNYARMFIRTTPGMAQDAQQSLMKLWKEFYPNRLLDAQWVTDILDKQYETEQKQQTLFSFFSGLMLFLSAMGVFGLIVHAAQQRVKEIGIRKVLGASIAGIVRLLSTDFVKLVVVAVVIASPVAWWAMNHWLDDFAYRIDVEWWMFALAGVAAVAIALLTVSWQAIRAAMANPVDSLRDE